jgi:tartrate dehydrogenase/decarboxylase / D-malate dehydrogenase
MLDHLGHPDAAQAVVKAIERVVSDANVLTRDLGGKASTADVGKAVAALI